MWAEAVAGTKQCVPCLPPSPFSYSHAPRFIPSSQCILLPRRRLDLRCRLPTSTHTLLLRIPMFSRSLVLSFSRSLVLSFSPVSLSSHVPSLPSSRSPPIPSQMKQLVFKQWQKSPENPMNQEALAYNHKG